MDGTVNLLIMLVFMFVLMLSVPRRSSVPICMARRPILARLFHINNSLFIQNHVSVHQEFVDRMTPGDAENLSTSKYMTHVYVLCDTSKPEER